MLFSIRASYITIYITNLGTEEIQCMHWKKTLHYIEDS